ncbi:hypothetical protein ACLFME_005389 [Klebsiella quasipneumoniae]|uniref:hypothetical protein n=1 Tax=Klebsiella michiganensis TaxID=1134687 RepID=UPI0018C5CD57|nr:hypothetical protein [Klebsiella michiganensis]EKW3301403.1 hypothetical protein [Klebsiella oxytoca]MBG2700530.1 hypothetical protein [Klebsiella michiganensis]UZL29986.1 hypothetical protein JMX05_01630 [Klebsiella pneumoniae]
MKAKEEGKNGRALVKVLSSDELSDLKKEYAEIGIDSLLDSGILKEIPLVGTLLGLYNVVDSVRDHIFTEKIFRFLTEFSELSEADRINMIDRLNEDDKFAGRAGERMLEIIDRIESEEKPELVATFLKAFSRKEISFEELRRLLSALERLPSFDLSKLPDFIIFDNDKAEGQTLSEAQMLSFVGAGLGQLKGGYGGSIIRPTELCKLFVKVGKIN